MDPKEPMSEVVAYLRKNLGKKMTAYVGGSRSQHLMNREAIPIETEMRLRYAKYTTLFITAAYGVDTTKAWLFRTNCCLNGSAPAWVLRHAKTISELEKVVVAAKTFIVS